MINILLIDITELFFITNYVQYSIYLKKGTNIKWEFFFLNKLISILKQFKENNNIILGICDGVDNWRKHLFPEYKSDRKEIRKLQKYMNWEKRFEEFEKMKQFLDEYTCINILEHQNLESDDIIASLCKLYSNNTQLTILSSDHDLHQLLVYPNVKLISLRTLKEKKIKNPIAELNKLIRNGDKTDNIPKAENYIMLIKNEILVDLLHLPKTIIEIVDIMRKIKTKKELNKDNIPYKYKNILKNIELLKGGKL